MATGDNVLTAISVGRECKIIEPHSEVFLGDVRKDVNGIEKVFWKSTKNNRKILNDISHEIDNQDIKYSNLYHNHEDQVIRE